MMASMTKATMRLRQDAVEELRLRRPDRRRSGRLAPLRRAIASGSVIAGLLIAVPVAAPGDRMERSRRPRYKAVALSCPARAGRAARRGSPWRRAPRRSRRRARGRASRWSRRRWRPSAARSAWCGGGAPRGCCRPCSPIVAAMSASTPGRSLIRTRIATTRSSRASSRTMIEAARRGSMLPPARISPTRLPRKRSGSAMTRGERRRRRRPPPSSSAASGRRRPPARWRPRRRAPCRRHGARTISSVSLPTFLTAMPSASDSPPHLRRLAAERRPQRRVELGLDADHLDRPASAP